MTRVLVVTPAVADSPTVGAFSNELAGFGWNVQDPSFFTVYSGANYQNGIQGAVGDAVKNVDANGVLVAGGEMAAFYLQQATAPAYQIPIILAFGGQAPSNAAAAGTKMIGFIGDCTQVAKNHVQALKLKHNYTVDQITVLYDKDGEYPTPNPPPGNINHVTQDILKALKHDDNLNYQKIDTTKIGVNIAGLLTTHAFMMIPNAAFFEQAATITSAVDLSGVEIAYYPEYYYYTKHTNKNKPKVSGFNVPVTYRLAASWVNDILLGSKTVQSIISGMNNKQFAQAIQYPYLTPY